MYTASTDASTSIKPRNKTIDNASIIQIRKKN